MLRSGRIQFFVSQADSAGDKLSPGNRFPAELQLLAALHQIPFFSQLCATSDADLEKSTDLTNIFGDVSCNAQITINLWLIFEIFE